MNITTVKAELSGMLHGTTINKITNIYGCFNRAARQVLMDVDPQETKRIVEFTNPIYSEVFDYALPTDLKGNKIIDIRPQANRTLRDIYLQKYGQAFDIEKDFTFQPNFAIQFNTAAKTIRIDAPQLPAGVLVNGADDVTSNGTWSTGGTASNIQTDNVNYASGSGSISFNLAAGANPSTGYVENSTMSSVDLTKELNQGALFFYVYLPTASDFTSISLRWGSSSANYYSRSMSVTAENTTFQNGWNLIRADWAGASVTGSPVVTAINYLRISYTYNGNAQTAVRADAVTARLGQILECVYYSKFLFRDAVTGGFQETVTDDTNLINLDTETFNLFLYQTMINVNQQALGQDSVFDSNMYNKLYQEALLKYKTMYKSEVQKAQTQYYQTPVPGYNQFLGRRFY